LLCCNRDHESSTKGNSTKGVRYVKMPSLALALTGLSIAACAAQAPDLPDLPDLPEEVAVAEQAVVTQCPFLDPLSTLAYAGPPVDYARELMTTHVSVVDNPCRTTWTGACGGGATQGIWTFGELMTRMAGTGSPQVL